MDSEYFSFFKSLKNRLRRNLLYSSVLFSMVLKRRTFKWFLMAAASLVSLLKGQLFVELTLDDGTEKKDLARLKSFDVPFLDVVGRPDFIEDDVISVGFLGEIATVKALV